MTRVNNRKGYIKFLNIKVVLELNKSISADDTT